LASLLLFEQWSLVAGGFELEAGECKMEDGKCFKNGSKMAAKWANENTFGIAVSPNHDHILPSSSIQHHPSCQFCSPRAKLARSQTCKLQAKLKAGKAKRREEREE